MESKTMVYAGVAAGGLAVALLASQRLRSSLYTNLSALVGASPAVGGPGRAEELATEGKPFRVFMGYDSHEDIVFQVASFSMKRRATVPIDITPLRRADLTTRGVYKKTQDPKQSTEFTYLRFLVPYLAGYKGWAMFADDDFLWLSDLRHLIDQIDDKYAVMVVKHKKNSTCKSKLAGVLQEPYPRKNWSSMVLFNCGHPANACLDLDMVNREGGAFLHRFAWLKDDDLIGEVPFTWNFLIDWYDPTDVPGHEQGVKADAVHYTDGGPYFPDYRHVDYAREWMDELRLYEATLPAPRLLSPYERFSCQGNKPLTGYANSGSVWSWDNDDDTNPKHVWVEPYKLAAKAK